jgi:hypothetical protein
MAVLHFSSAGSPQLNYTFRLMADLAVFSHAALSFNIQKWDDGMEPESTANILVADDVLDWRVRIRSIVQQRTEWLVTAEVCDGLQVVEKASERRA